LGTARMLRITRATRPPAVESLNAVSGWDRTSGVETVPIVLRSNR
jgi:hypothetical protein